MSDRSGTAEHSVDAHLIINCYGKPDQVLQAIAEAGRRLIVAGVNCDVRYTGNGLVGEAGVMYRCQVHPSGNVAEMVPEHSWASWTSEVCTDPNCCHDPACEGPCNHKRDPSHPDGIIVDQNLGRLFDDTELG